MQKVWLTLTIISFFMSVSWVSISNTTSPSTNITPRNTIPKVQITGGKKIRRGNDGNIKGVDPVPGLSHPVLITWKELSTKYFDFDRVIPSPQKEELTFVRGLLQKREITTVDLPRFMKNFTQKTFTDPKYKANEEWVKSFGNIINEFKLAKGNQRQTEKLINQLKKQYPLIYKELDPYLVQLVRDDFLYSTKWDPYKDESVKGLKNDGILFVDHWYMKKNPNRHNRWNQNLGEHKVYQGAAILYADVQTIKEMEKDYAKYFSQVGQDYLEVYPVMNSYFYGLDPRGNEFLRMELFLRNDLPFPYESASYIMNILEHYDNEDYLLADYYSSNQEDLNWMAGRDTYIPIKTTQGKLVGNMIVTVLDFDIKNVPERDIDRIVSMKAGLGNMKRISEKLLENKNQTAIR